jgi:hypothetical protein
MFIPKKIGNTLFILLLVSYRTLKRLYTKQATSPKHTISKFIDYAHFCWIALLLSNLLLTSCFYFPDLRGETVGSVTVATAAGLAIASTTSNLIVLGSGIIIGSVFGGMIGQDYDNQSPLRLEQPMTDPVPLFYYKTLRPPLREQRFTPAQIIT